MNDWVLVYILSVADGLSSCLGFLAFASGCALALSFSPHWWFTLSKLEEEHRDRTLANAAKLRPKLLIAFLACLGVATLLPSMSDLTRAYVMVEGSKIVTAENATKATAEIVKRVDELIGKIGEKGSGR